MKRFMARQGDICLIRCTLKDVDGKVLEPQRQGRFILAYGEVTGHDHSVAAENCEFLREAEDGTLYLKVKSTTKLQHQEHGAITLEPGVYKTVRQREYARGEVRNVLD